MSGHEESNEVYLELKSLDEDVKTLNARLDATDEQIADLNQSKLVLGKLGNLKEGANLRVPLSNGIYVEAALHNPKNVMVNVGAGVIVEKTPDEVMVILDKQIDELMQFRQKLVTAMKKIIERVEELQKDFG